MFSARTYAFGKPQFVKPDGGVQEAYYGFNSRYEAATAAALNNHSTEVRVQGDGGYANYEAREFLVDIYDDGSDGKSPEKKCTIGSYHYTVFSLGRTPPSVLEQIATEQPSHSPQS